jgi:hypothetical protein
MMACSAGCFGTHLAYLAIRNSDDRFDQPTTITVTLVDDRWDGIPHATEPAPHPPTYWAAAAVLDYPH